MKGKWFDIAENIREKIDAGTFQQRWVLDPKGYFLIRINRQENCIEVGHCTADNNLIRVIKGKTPESIMYKIIDLGGVSLLDHAAYLGKELQKASLALEHGFAYEQDSELKKTISHQKIKNPNHSRAVGILKPQMGSLSPIAVELRGLKPNLSTEKNSENKSENKIKDKNIGQC